MSLRDLCLNFIEEQFFKGDLELLSTKTHFLSQTCKTIIAWHLFGRLKKCGQPDNVSKSLKEKINILVPDLSEFVSNFYGWDVKEIRLPRGAIGKNMVGASLSPDGQYLLYHWDTQGKCRGMCDVQRECSKHFVLEKDQFLKKCIWAKDDSRTYMLMMCNADKGLENECFAEQWHIESRRELKKYEKNDKYLKYTVMDVTTVGKPHIIMDKQCLQKIKTVYDNMIMFPSAIVNKNDKYGTRFYVYWDDTENGWKRGWHYWDVGLNKVVPCKIVPDNEWQTHRSLFHRITADGRCHVNQKFANLCILEKLQK